ncbi:COP9 signalosome complex subunit 6 isoform X3 [Gopherus flavomarginatus]|uniref:COP9 signalosome complex subunit 6 isoform X2 n=1 Tax=Gopherus flavomarginatus TaxID=286002 RepID=UPI0021CBF937|nr:COP9 signalosome complex subunit 6 isoform X2 [Gopherus flavomarginatus]XP_050789364.1 COP9 signalosome complex subunit 6 isoform X3 [Gopherus flavomarginatus]
MAAAAAADASCSVAGSNGGSGAGGMEVDAAVLPTVMASGVTGSVSVALHPLVILNISDHWIRMRSQEGRPVQGTRLGLARGAGPGPLIPGPDLPASPRRPRAPHTRARPPGIPLPGPPPAPGPPHTRARPPGIPPARAAAGPGAPHTRARPPGIPPPAPRRPRGPSYPGQTSRHPPAGPGAPHTRARPPGIPPARAAAGPGAPHTRARPPGIPPAPAAVNPGPTSVPPSHHLAGSHPSAALLTRPRSLRVRSWESAPPFPLGLRPCWAGGGCGGFCG